MNRRLVMLGTAPDTRGGIAAVVNAYRAHGLFERWPIEYIPTHRDGAALPKLLTAVRALLAFIVLLARERRVVLHVHSASRASFWRKSIFMAIGMCAGSPVILHLHGGGFARFYETECGWAGRRLIRFCLDRAACVIVLSAHWRAWVAGVTQNKRVVCIPNPVAPAAAWPGPRREDLVLFVGRVARGKGVFDLLDAVRGLRASIPGVRLVCAGEGDLESVARYAARLGIGDAVTLTGWIGPDAKQSFMRRAAVFVLPSHAEGMPMSLLEAMAAGVPVVAAAAGGIPDVVADGVNGLLFPPGNTAQLERLLRRMLLAPDLGERVARTARESVRLRFAPGRVIAQLEKIYAELGLQAGRQLSIPEAGAGPTCAE
jgi:glycosyltransferase involved in cell wall biosynthesis